MKKILHLSALFVLLCTLLCVFASCGEEFTVEFKAQDGTVLKTETVAEGGAATAPEAPAIDNYTFAGWDKKFDNVTGNLTITATYTENAKYTVTFVDEDGTTLKTETVYTGKGATAPETNPTKENYTFAAWDKAFDNITADTTITATYTENAKYTVTFVDHDGTTLKTETVYTGKGVTAPADPTRENYTFTGWDKTFDNITANTTVTATYAENAKYNVVFADHDGSELKTEVVYTGNAATAPADPTRDGYRFTGWDVAFNFITAETTVTAQYVKVWNVTFVDHDDTPIGDVQVIDEGSTAVAPNAPSRTGYRFDKWSVAYNNITEDTTVKAEYVKVWTVQFTDHDDTLIGDAQIIDEGNAAVAPTDPTRENYKFTGWSIAFDNVTADLTVKAEYARLWTVQFQDYDGTNLGDAQIVEDGKAATAPETNPTREHYTFNGWDTAFDSVTSDLTIKATYTEHEKFTVTFKDHDGTTIGEVQTVYVGEAATAPADPKRSGYTFTGWDKAFDNITETLEVNAVYVENPKYTVLQWTTGDTIAKVDPSYTNMKATIASVNPDFFVMRGINTNDFGAFTLDGYGKLGFGSGNDMKNAGWGHFIFYKTSLFTAVGDATVVKEVGGNTKVSFVIQKFTTVDGRTIGMVSAYFAALEDAHVTRFKKDIATNLSGVDFAITAIHVATDVATDTLTTYQDKFTYSDADANGMKLICGEGVDAMNNNNEQIGSTKRHFNYIGIYSAADGTIEAGTMAVVTATEDTTVFKPTGIKYGTTQGNAFLCKAYTTAVTMPLNTEAEE